MRLWDPARPGTLVLEINTEDSTLATSSHTDTPAHVAAAGAQLTLWEVADATEPASQTPRDAGSRPRPRTF